VAEAWLKYLREELPTVAFKCSTQRQATNLGQRRLPTSVSADGGFGTGSECLGADALLHLLKNYARASDIKTAITVGESARALVGNLLLGSGQSACGQPASWPAARVLTAILLLGSLLLGCLGVVRLR
jgi:nuclear GTP-binding protein